MAGKARKAPNTLQGHRAGRRGLEVVPATEAPKVPEPTTTSMAWLAVTKERWVVFWGSESGRHVDRDSAAEMMAVHQWFMDWDELERCQRAYRRERLVRGSMGQKVLNPLAGEIDRLRKRIDAVGAKFGWNPTDKMRLGLTEAKTARTLADLNKELEEDRPTKRPSLADLEAMKVVSPEEGRR